MIVISYLFTLAGGGVISHEVKLDSLTGASPPAAQEDFPAWVDLHFHQCPNCPLDRAATPRCPAAEKIAPLTALANSLVSHDQIEVEIVTPERRIVQTTTAQRAMSALVGLELAASGCPLLAYFRPMARFHLPLATEEETAYRAMSMYLCAQYFVRQKGAESDFTLEGLKKIYGQLQQVNRAFAARLRAASDQDAAVNALVLLDMFAKGVPYTIDQALYQFDGLFSAYFPRSPQL